MLTLQQPSIGAILHSSMIDDDLLYRTVGTNIRIVRERLVPKMSQTQLAKKLGVSRVSIVNIEAGRQHAPLHLLWRIAELLGTELALLIPRQDEFLSNLTPVKLDAETVARIEAVANGDPETRRRLAVFIGRVKSRS